MWLFQTNAVAPAPRVSVKILSDQWFEVQLKACQFFAAQAKENGQGALHTAKIIQSSLEAAKKSLPKGADPKVRKRITKTTQQD